MYILCALNNRFHCILYTDILIIIDRSAHTIIGISHVCAPARDLLFFFFAYAIAAGKALKWLLYIYIMRDTYVGSRCVCFWYLNG